MPPGAFTLCCTRRHSGVILTGRRHASSAASPGLNHASGTKRAEPRIRAQDEGFHVVRFFVHGDDPRQNAMQR